MSTSDTPTLGGSAPGESDTPLTLRRGLPGWTMRGLVAVAAGAIIVLLAAHGISGVALGILVFAAVISMVAPASPAPALALLVVAISVAALAPDPFSVLVLALVPLVHLLHVASAIAGVLPVGSRVHLAALRAPAVRFVVVQAVVFALAGLLTLAPEGRVPAALELAAILGVAAIALLVAYLLHRPDSA